MRISQLSRVLTLSTLVGLLTSCGGGDSGTPLMMASPLNIAGNYSGSNTDSASGHGMINANVVQAGKSLSGLWTFSYPSIANPAVSFMGTLNTNILTLSIPSTSFSPCAYAVMGTVSGKQIAGSYMSANCGNSGTFSIARP